MVIRDNGSMSYVSQPQHASRPSPIRGPALPIGFAITTIGVLISLATATASASSTLHETALPRPVAVQDVPAVHDSATPAADPCSEPSVVQAMSTADDAAIIAAFGGGEPFRDAVAAGNAPCIALDDPARVWVVVNKLRPLEPVEFAPSSLTAIPLQMTTRSSQSRADVAAAAEAMAAAAEDDGVGAIGANNGYRSYDLQVATHSAHVRAWGQESADMASARAGHSEHQTGLALDLVACDRSCGGIEGFGSTAQGTWVAENAWRFGFVVRYEDAGRDVTGYRPEPWHLRYVGTALAKAYHDGGYNTLEEFFGLPAAPDYPG